MPGLSKVSIIIPTLNASRVLTDCLQSIRSQNYPQTKIEIIIADGGSSDSTLAIARKFDCRVYSNPLKTSEAGKAVGITKSTGQYFVLIDSDNILPHQDWLHQMLSPFITSPQIIGSEPIEFTYRPHSGFIERYSALFGANDPYAYFIGHYDRINHLSGRWTGLPISSVDRPTYLLLTLKPNSPIPTIGANGTVFQSDFIKNNFKGDYLFDIDIISHVLAKSHQPLYFAKVKTGIIHTYCESSTKKFIKKQVRRVKDIFFYQPLRTYPWSKTPFNLKNILFPLYSLSIIFPLSESVRGFIKIHDTAWFFHPIACLITSVIYSVYTILHFLGFKLVQSRDQWRQ